MKRERLNGRNDKGRGIMKLTNYAKSILKNNPEKVKAIREKQKICKAIESCGLEIISIEEMNKLLGLPTLGIKAEAR